MPQEKLLEYYIKKSDERFDRLEAKIDKLMGFKWRLVGAASGVSIVISVLFEMAKAIAGSK